VTAELVPPVAGRCSGKNALVGVGMEEGFHLQIIYCWARAGGSFFASGRAVTGRGL
jgi:hypothetical protein